MTRNEVLTKNKKFRGNLKKYFKEYNEVTGIQGMRYITEERSKVEKIFWIIVLLVSLAFCISMIYEILLKYQNSPVVVSFSTEDTPVFEMPFPAVTICSEAKYNRTKFNYSKVLYQLINGTNVDHEDLKKFSVIHPVCGIPPEEETESLEKIMKSSPNITNFSFFETLEELKLNRDMIFGCSFMDNEGLCSDLFIPTITDEGICYSFNLIGRHELFRNQVVHYSNYNEVKNDSRKYFDSQFGYNMDAGINTYPRRGLRAGADNALTLFLYYNSSHSDFACNYFFQGFKILIHNPWDLPHVSKNYVLVPLDKVVSVGIDPEFIVTSDTVKRFNPEKRKCYMTDERPLKYFQEYGQSNCVMECLANYTLQKCKCLPFYMRSFANTSICGILKLKCIEEAEVELNIQEMEAQLEGISTCDCKPTCTDLKYSLETSQTDFYIKEYIKAHPKNTLDLGNESHLSAAIIYFKNEQFFTKERNELYGISDLISNLGGLLGLFTGFSLISLAEIVYFCSLRIFYNKRTYGVWSGPPENVPLELL